MASEANTAEGGKTAGEYIIHHLQHLQNQPQQGVVDFSVVNLDSLFFAIVLGVLSSWLLWSVARKATAGVPGRMWCSIASCGMEWQSIRIA